MTLMTIVTRGCRKIGLHGIGHFDKYFKETLERHECKLDNEMSVRMNVVSGLLYVFCITERQQ